METKRELLIERKSLKKNNGTYEFRISTRTGLMEEDYMTTYDERKEILFIEFYNTPNKNAIFSSYRKGADFTTPIAKNLLQNKKVIDGILELYSLPKNSKNAFRIFEYLSSVDSLLGDLATLINNKERGV